MTKIKLPPKKKVASFDVHTQKTFTPLCPDELPVPEGDQIVAELNAQAKKAFLRIGSKEAHHPHAIWVTHNPAEIGKKPVIGDHVDVAWPPHSITGTRGFELLDGLPKVTDYDYFVWEGIELDLHPYGACYHDHHEKLSTGVIEYLQAHHISTVIVGGLATDYCVKTTALQLRRAGFEVIINLGACRGLAEKSMQLALQEMHSSGIQFVSFANDLISS